jgi:hypothetical protein
MQLWRLKRTAAAAAAAAAGNVYGILPLTLAKKVSIYLMLVHQVRYMPHVCYYVTNTSK